MPSSATNVSLDELRQLSALMRRWILTSSTTAGSGHPTSSLSAVELMSALFFGGVFRYDVNQPENPVNDRLIFSKGHASPLFYALWSAAGQINPEELTHYRQFESPLEGHPTSRFRFTEAATGSLGQGLSIGVGMALNAKVDRLPYRTFVLLGDSEMTEGSQWEAIQLAEHYRLKNLIGILDVNRLGQRGPTLLENDLGAYQRRIEAFGWRTIVVDDGHDLARLLDAYIEACSTADAPSMLIANTIKGKGVPELEDQRGWHGKALDKEQLADALGELGAIDESLRGTIAQPPSISTNKSNSKTNSKNSAKPKSSAETGNTASNDQQLGFSVGDQVATREAFGQAMKRLGETFPTLVSLDGEVSNSTKAETFAKAYPDRFFEMFIAEQNMVGVATGLALRGKLPVVSSFAAFLTRAFDQIRMSVYSGANLKLVGSHCGVSIGQDGPSQMGLEDIAMFRTVFGSVVVYPCDAVSYA
jgi:transketolase